MSGEERFPRLGEGDRVHFIGPVHIAPAPHLSYIKCALCEQRKPGPGVFRRDLGEFGGRVCTECEQRMQEEAGRWDATCQYMEHGCDMLYDLVKRVVTTGMRSAGEDPANMSLFWLRCEQVTYSLNSRVERERREWTR